MNTWKTIYQLAEYPIRIEQTFVAGRAMHRVMVGNQQNAGAIAVVTTTAGELLLVAQNRVAVGQRLWELPRGGAELDDHDICETARRELYEETGYALQGGRDCGHVYPDTGLFGSQIGVVHFVVDRIPQPNEHTDGEIDELRWVNREVLGELISAGKVSDALSLAALTIAGYWTESSR